MASVPPSHGLNAAARKGAKLEAATVRELRRAKAEQRQRAALHKIQTSKVDKLKALAIGDLQAAMAPYRNKANKKTHKAKKAHDVAVIKAARVKALEAIAASDLKRALLPKPRKSHKAKTRADLRAETSRKLEEATGTMRSSLLPNPDLWDKAKMRSLQTRVFDRGFLDSDED